MILLMITLELRMILKNIWRSILGNVLNNIFPSNNFPHHFFSARFYRNCQAVLAAVSINGLTKIECINRFKEKIFLWEFKNYPRDSMGMGIVPESEHYPQSTWRRESKLLALYADVYKRTYGVNPGTCMGIVQTLVPYSAWGDSAWTMKLSPVLQSPRDIIDMGVVPK